MTSYVKIVAGCLVAVILILTGLFVKEEWMVESEVFKPKATEPTTISKTFDHGDFSTISKIVIMDGSTGDREMTTNQEVIQNFLDKVKDITYIPQKDQSLRTGFSYSVSLFERDEKVYSFSLQSLSPVRGYFYTEPDMRPILDDFFISLKKE